MTNKNTKGAGDDVMAALNKSEAFFDKNRKAIIGVVVAIIVIIAALFIYSNYIAGPREEKASTELAKYQAMLDAGQYDTAAEGFLKVAGDFGGTDAANLANLYAGLCYANQDKWDEAAKYLEKYDGADDAMVSPAAQAALGNVYANKGETDKAVAALKKAASMADKASTNKTNYSLSATFLIQAGQLLESQGKKEEALKLYEEVKAKYVNARQVQSKEIDKYIERLNQQ